MLKTLKKELYRKPKNSRSLRIEKDKVFLYGLYFFCFLSFLNLASQTAFFSSVLVDIFPPVVFVYLLFKSLFFSFAFWGL